MSAMHHSQHPPRSEFCSLRNETRLSTLPSHWSQALAAEFGVGALAANPDEHIPDGQESARLAIVDLDWDRIRAVDILVVLSSFLRRPQAIQAVTIYPSDFGQQAGHSFQLHRRCHQRMSGVLMARRHRVALFEHGLFRD